MYFEWVKIDLEKWPAGKELPQLPFAVAEMMDGDKASMSEETKTKISRLYEDVFLMKNTNEPLASYAEPENEQPAVAADSQNVPGAGSEDNPNQGEDDNGNDDPDGTGKPAAGKSDDGNEDGSGGSADGSDGGKDGSKRNDGSEDDSGSGEGETS
jgi:hypothetical protein